MKHAMKQPLNRSTFSIQGTEAKASIKDNPQLVTSKDF